MLTYVDMTLSLINLKRVRTLEYIQGDLMYDVGTGTNFVELRTQKLYDEKR